MFECDVCILYPMWINSKRFFIVLFVFGSDFYRSLFLSFVLCFSKFFKLILSEKHVFWVFSQLISRVV